MKMNMIEGPQLQGIANKRYLTDNVTYHDGSDDSYGPELPKIHPRINNRSRYKDARTDVEPTNTKMSKIQKQIEAEKWRQRSRA